MLYFDNNATSFLDPAVLTAMRLVWEDSVGNPSSIHRYGQKAKGLLVEATRVCAQFFKVQPDEIIFTSGATESLNALIFSLPSSAHIITSSLEHAAITAPLKKWGGQVDYLDPLLGEGAITSSQIQGAIRPNTGMILLSGANSETGIEIDLEDVASLAYQMQVPFVVDGVALVGKKKFILPKGVAAFCCSAHKFHGPCGIGLLIVRRNFPFKPYIQGGGQQKGQRSGTENVAFSVGMAKALELLEKNASTWIDNMLALRDLFEKKLREELPGIVIHGENKKRVSNTSNIAFLGVEGESLLMLLDRKGLAASHGSACTSGLMQVSRVLLNMGIMPEIAKSSLRFSFSRFTKQEDIEAGVKLLIETVQQLRRGISYI